VKGARERERVGGRERDRERERKRGREGGREGGREREIGGGGRERDTCNPIGRCPFAEKPTGRQREGQFVREMA